MACGHWDAHYHLLKGSVWTTETPSFMPTVTLVITTSVTVSSVQMHSFCVLPTVYYLIYFILLTLFFLPKRHPRQLTTNKKYIYNKIKCMNYKMQKAINCRIHIESQPVANGSLKTIACKNIKWIKITWSQPDDQHFVFSSWWNWSFYLKTGRKQDSLNSKNIATWLNHT